MRRSGGPQLIAMVWLLLAAAPVGAGECATLSRLLGSRPIPESTKGLSPTRWWRRVSFSPACLDLRLCLSRLGEERRGCLRDFRAELERRCRSGYSDFAEGPARRRCLVAVQRVMARVEATGEGPYQDAQYQAIHLQGAGPSKIPDRFRRWLPDP